VAVDSAKDLHLVMVSDARYSDLTAVAVHTALRASEDPGRLTLHLLWADREEAGAEDLRRLVERRGGRCDLYPVAEQVASDDRYRGLTPHYYRLLAPDVLPADAPRFIYLDSDLLVLTDLTQLMAVDLADCVVAACVDYLRTVGQAMSNHAALGLPPDAPYLNSGVMLVDRARWLADRVSDQVLEATRTHAQYLDAQGRFHQYDQYGLNLVLFGRWKPIADSWNRGAEYPFTQAHIVHFNGHGRPWGPTCRPEYRRLFREAWQEIGWGGSPPGGAAALP
jgi:lipopolysaccharide biosynthesis glycosyltransferase